MIFCLSCRFILGSSCVLFVLSLITDTLLCLSILIHLCQLFWLSCHYLPNDCLERLLWGCPSVVRSLSSQSPGWRERLCVSFSFCMFMLLCGCSGPTHYICHKWLAISAYGTKLVEAHACVPDLPVSQPWNNHSRISVSNFKNKRISYKTRLFGSVCIYTGCGKIK